MSGVNTDDKLRQLRTVLADAASRDDGGDIITLMKEAVEDWIPDHSEKRVGTVERIADGIAIASGLERAAYGEIVIFEDNTRGMVQDLRKSDVGIMLFGDEGDISAGSSVTATGKIAGVPVGDGFIGRVVDGLGNPIDGRGKIYADGYRQVEEPAPGIIDRQPVNRPLATGLLAIDSMFPIGRGQRELIIGDRQTGKTAIAIDAILNQKDGDVICVYVAVGQKASSVAHLVETLRRTRAMDYTIVVNATASDPAPLQYIAPYTGCAIGEYFMNRGRDVLIIYDDLSKHAIAYRTISLLLERSPGREAYPGDVFYLHSRLLERSAHLSDELGGGSMTALPIIETQGGDVSAYIPTNVISITDGQIFLESDLFFAGQRPAVNVGLSVSRVGGDAQTKAMKKAVKGLRLSLAQFREMEVFTQFASELDDATKRQLAYGQTLMRLLRQPQYNPLSMGEQVVLLLGAMNGAMEGVAADDVPEYGRGMLEYVKEKIAGVYAGIMETGQLSDEDREIIISTAKEYGASVEKRHGAG